MLRATGWRIFLPVLIFLAADAALGVWLAGNSQVETYIYKWGLFAATLVPLIFAGIYTISGLRGSGKWWQNTLGTSLVLASLTLIPITGPFLYAIWYENGKVASPWVVWTEISGPVLSAAAWLSLCWVIVRIRRDHAGSSEAD